MDTTGDGSMDEDEHERPDGAEAIELAPSGSARPRRRRSLWAVLAIVGVVAGALVVTTVDEDGDPRPGLPIDLASAARAAGGGTEAAADSSMPAWVVYVAGEDLPPLGGEATAYRLSGDVDEGQVEELAAALGLDAEVDAGPDRTWSVTTNAGRLDVYVGGGAHWTYTPSSGTAGAGGGSSSTPGCDGGADCATTTTVTACPDPPEGQGCATAAAACVAPPPGTEPEPCDDTVVGIACPEELYEPGSPLATSCVPPVALPASDLPTEDEARQAALDVVAASGTPVDGARVEALANPYSWSVTVEPLLDGVPSGLLSSVEVGPDRHVLSGHGQMGAPEGLGSYPRLDARATIDRANANAGTAVDPGPAVDGGTGSTGVDDPAATDPSTAVPQPVPCKVQPDGSEICEVTHEAEVIAEEPGEAPTTIAPDLPTCPPSTTEDGIALGAPDVACQPPSGGDPQPIEIVLVDAVPSLVLLPATDGSADGYLVPAYRFTAEDGGTVDLPAVADDALAGSPSTDTTVPDTVVPEPAPVPEPPPCEVLEEADPASGTTHTVQSCPPDEVALVIGAPYYVDIDVECGGGTFVLGGRTWITDDEDVAGWADPGERHEGGTFTLDAEDHGTFVGDAEGTLTAEFRPLGPAEDIFCTPEPRG